MVNETDECESARNSVERKRKYVDDVRAEGAQLKLIVYHAPFGRGVHLLKLSWFPGPGYGEA